MFQTGRRIAAAFHARDGHGRNTVGGELKAFVFFEIIGAGKQAVDNRDDETKLDSLRREVKDFVQAFPLPSDN